MTICLDPLGPFDGKVAAILGEYLITTPNQDVIWFPPWGKRNVCLRADIRYGFDDPTLWPQPYLIDYPHLGAIPRKPDSEDDPLAIMWWNPTESDFISTSSNLVNGLGSLALEKFEKLCLCKNELMRRIDRYKAGTNSPNHFLLVMSKATLHACVRIGCLTTSFLEMKFGVTEFQRYYLETLGVFDYLEIYKPRMDGIQTHTGSVDNRMGIFTSTPRVAQEFFDAGLPVWFIRETNNIISNPNNAPNVLALFEPRIPHDYVIVDDAKPPFPAVYRGYTNIYKKHTATHAYSRTWLVYRDAFATEADGPVNVENPIDPFTLPRATPRESTTISMRDLLKERLPQESSSRREPLVPQGCKQGIIFAVYTDV